MDNYLIPLFTSLIAVNISLVALIWRYQIVRIAQLEAKIAALPHLQFANDIGQIKTDLEWIKLMLREK